LERARRFRDRRESVPGGFVKNVLFFTIPKPPGPLQAFLQPPRPFRDEDEDQQFLAQGPRER
jgi:hypothetical protein